MIIIFFAIIQQDLSIRNLTAADGKIQCMLFQCHTQTAGKLLIDLRIGHNASQQRQRIVDQRGFIIRHPRRVFLARLWMSPRLR